MRSSAFPIVDLTFHHQLHHAVTIVQLWDKDQLSSSKMVLNRDCTVRKSEAVKL